MFTVKNETDDSAAILGPGLITGLDFGGRHDPCSGMRGRDFGELRFCGGERGGK